jgi:hypothetical protein
MEVEKAQSENSALRISSESMKTNGHAPANSTAILKTSGSVSERQKMTSSGGDDESTILYGSKDAKDALHRKARADRISKSALNDGTFFATAPKVFHGFKTLPESFYQFANKCSSITIFVCELAGAWACSHPGCARMQVQALAIVTSPFAIFGRLLCSFHDTPISWSVLTPVGARVCRYKSECGLHCWHEVFSVFSCFFCAMFGFSDADSVNCLSPQTDWSLWERR